MQETKALISRWRGNLGVVLERRPQCAVSHGVRRRGQWASRGAPGQSVSMRVARGSASWLPSHGRGIWPRDVLKKDLEYVQIFKFSVASCENLNRKGQYISINFLKWILKYLQNIVMSDFLQPHGIYSPRNSPSQNTGVGSLSLFQGIFPTWGSDPSLPHCQRILYQLSHKGNPI